MKNYKKQKNISNYIIITIILIMTICLNSTIVKANDNTVISGENWDKWQNEDYWEWHTRTTTNDMAYNGRHIVIENDVIDFYGYWKNSYKDFLYKEYENPGKKIFKFRIDESKANYHTLDGAGFIFNASKENNKLSGYILLFREKDVCIYRIDNVDINTFETASSSTIATYGTLIQSKSKTNSTIHDLVVEATPTNIKVTEGENEILNVNLDYSKHIGESFGLISSYLQHACSILSKIEFSQIRIILEDYNISVLNTDMDNNPIQGGYFELKDENGNMIKEGKTNGNGEFILEGLKEGTYTIQQKIPPSTYLLNDNIYTFKVTNEGKVVDKNTGEEIELIIKNEKMKIEINNKIINTNTAIKGSVIGIYDEDGKQIATDITNEDGKVVFTGISEGNYVYKQLEVPDGYVLNTTEYMFTVNKDGTVEFKEDNKETIYNEKIQNSLNNINTNNNIDNTIANTKIPNAGEKTGIISIIAISILINIFLIFKLKEYKEIK